MSHMRKRAEDLVDLIGGALGVDTGTISESRFKEAVAKTEARLAATIPHQEWWQDLNDARCVLGGMGITRSVCTACKRRTVTSGYVCWSCGNDGSEGKEPKR